MKTKIIIQLAIILLSTVSLKSQNIDSLKLFIDNYKKKISTHINKVSPYINHLNNTSDSAKISEITWDGYTTKKYFFFFHKSRGIGGDDIYASKDLYDTVVANLRTNSYGGKPNFFTTKSFSFSEVFLRNKLILYEVSITNSLWGLKLNSYKFKYYFNKGKLFYSEESGRTLKNKKRFLKKAIKKHNNWHISI